MKKFFSDFKAFALKGNVIDLAVAVIIGGAFGKITASLVNDIIMPLFGVLLGGVNFSELSANIGGVNIMYGLFIQALIDFLIIAFTIFIVIRILGNFKRKKPEAEAAEEPAAKADDILLLEEIRDLLKNHKS